MKARQLMVAAICVIGLTAAACGSSDGDSDTGSATTSDASGTPATEPAPDLEPDPNGTVRAAHFVPVAKLDPFTQGPLSGTPVLWMLSPIFDRLLENGPDGTLEPMLAESYEVAEDGSSITLQLRDGVTFHDATPFNAEAVKVNLERAQTVEGSSVAPALSALESVDVIDDLTVRLNLNGPGQFVLAELAWMGGMMISPAAIATGDIESNPVGAGPFQVVRFTPNESAVLERYDGYYDPDRVHAQRLELSTIPDETARLNAVRGGDVDVTIARTTVFPDLNELASDGYHLINFQATNPNVVHFNANDGGVMADPDVRKAVSLAIDREAICEEILFDQCTMTRQIIPPGGPGSNDALDAEEDLYDPDRAQELLASAGVEGSSIRLMTVPVEPQKTIGEIVAAQLQAIGLDVTIEPADVQTFVQKWTSGEYDVLVSSSATLPGTLVSTYNLYFGQRANVFNLGGPQARPEIQMLAEQLIDLSLPDEERIAALEELNGVLLDETAVAVINNSYSHWIGRPNVTGFEDVAEDNAYGGINAFDPVLFGVAAE